MFVHDSTVEVAEIGVRTFEHSGGLVVLRWKPDLEAGRACSGGLQLLDNALRWIFGLNSGSSP